MDWPALSLSLRLAFWTCVILIPLGVVIARALAFRPPRAKGLIEALVAVQMSEQLAAVCVVKYQVQLGVGLERIVQVHQEGRL